MAGTVQAAARTRQPMRTRMPAARWVMVWLCFLALAVNYTDRANLAVAAPSIKQALGVDNTTMGLLLGSFFWTYALMQLPAGWLVDRYGARLMFPIAVCWWSLFTALTAVANSAATLFGFRLLLGAGEAGGYPASARVVSRWFPPHERGVASSIFDSGSRVGNLAAIPLCAWLIGSFGWRASFVVTGLLGFVWAAAWLLIYRKPEQHPDVTPEALREMEESRATPASSEQTGDEPPMRWISLFRYRTIWGMMIGFFCLNFVIYFFITWFPTYLMTTRHFSLRQFGTLGLIPGLIAVPGGWLGGFTSDWLYRRGWSLTAARKTCLVGGMLLSSVITLAAVVPAAWMALVLFGVAYASLAFTAASIWSLPGDVAPTRSQVASIGGIQNFASNLAGVVTTSFTGVMLTITHGSFVIPLATAGGLCLVGAATYLFVVGPIAPLPVIKAPGLVAQSGR
ncbi:MFS transporter [Lichenicoccus sp.]|uniref:MFS transporter n=1 Tax=Lichenicoccus sp. TaxID=2781899 RepID=UPI003D14BA31